MSFRIARATQKNPVLKKNKKVKSKKIKSTHVIIRFTSFCFLFFVLMFSLLVDIKLTFYRKVA